MKNIFDTLCEIFFQESKILLIFKIKWMIRIRY